MGYPPGIEEMQGSPYHECLEGIPRTSIVLKHLADEGSIFVRTRGVMDKLLSGNPRIATDPTLRNSTPLDLLHWMSVGPSKEDHTSGNPITELLRSAEAGSPTAREELFHCIYSELHRTAEALMRKQPRGHTLQPTALVSEVYLRLFRGTPGPWNDRRHFLLAASRAMRHVLIDHARRKSSDKRQQNRSSASLDELVMEYEDRALDLEALQKALERLEVFDPQMTRAIELRFFGGASVDEAARVLDLPRRTFERRWQMTRAWLYKEIR